VNDETKALYTDNWIPWAYLDTWNFSPRVRSVAAFAVPLDGKIHVDDNGRRYVRYQTSKSPIKPGSLRVGGYLRSTEAGELLNSANVQAGVVDFTNGLFEVWIDYDKSPGSGSREVVYEVAT